MNKENIDKNNNIKKKKKTETVRSKEKSED